MKLFTLTFNELKKIFAKPGFVLLLVLIFLLSAAIPVFIHSISVSQPYDDSQYYLEDYEQLKAYYESIKTSGTVGDVIYARGDMERAELVVDAGIKSYDDWRMQKTWPLAEDVQRREVYRMFLTGSQKQRDALQESGLLYLLDSQALEEYYTKGSQKKLKARYSATQKRIDEAKQAIINNDSAFFAARDVTEGENTVKALKTRLSELKKQLKKYPKEKDTIQPQIDETNRSIVLAEEKLGYAKLRITLGATYENDDWKNKTLSRMETLLETIYAPIPTQEEFKENYAYEIQYKGLTYEKFLERLETERQKALDERLINDYSLENSMPRADFAASTRAKSTGVYDVLLLVSFAVVILTSSIVSQEFHKGTIRLLLTRGVRRWKILLAKFLSVFLLGVVMMVLCCSAFLGMTIAMNGMADFSVPLLSVQAGTVVEVSALGHLLSVLLQGSIVVVFFLALAFFCTTVAKSTVLAVGLPMGLMAISPIVTEIVRYSSSDLAKTLLSYTPCPYVSLATLIGDNAGLLSYESYLFGGAGGFAFDPALGTLVLGVSTVVLLLVSFWVFLYRDVK